MKAQRVSTPLFAITGLKIQTWFLIVGLIAVLFLSFYNLTGFPVMWFDEGSHLHVPKTLVMHGVYADMSSEGFRFYGPTTGIGPTVFLPIALVFQVFGIGLLQARMVMALFLVATVVLLYVLARTMGGPAFALVAVGLAVTSRGIDMLPFGRQVLGEVPAMGFLAAGLVIWFQAWKRPGWRPLVASGVLLGLSLVTKNQFLIAIAPGLGLAYLANLVYYRSVPQRVFWITGAVTVGVYLAWQVILIFGLGPGTAAENLALFRKATADSALVFSTILMKRSLGELFSLKVFFGLLAPALAYGLVLALPRKREGLMWAAMLFMTASNLAWYVLASIGWLRYAFPALVFSAFFLARLFMDLTDGMKVPLRAAWDALRQGNGIAPSVGLRLVFIFWLAVILLVPLGQNTLDIVRPADRSAFDMAAYLDANVDQGALIETWEQELGFLTNHRYHYPPQALLYTANSFIWLGGEPPSSGYRFVQENRPDYVLAGPFSTWVQLYPQAVLDAEYTLQKDFGPYRLYARR